MWSRVAAVVARLVQSLVPKDLGRRLDNSLWGALQKRTGLLSCIITTMAALGLKVNRLAKGERSMRVTRSGVQAISNHQTSGIQHFANQPAREVHQRAPRPVEGLAGKVSWLAGVLIRARCATPVLYAALFDHEDAVEKGDEERQPRQEQAHRSPCTPVVGGVPGGTQ